MEIPSHLRSFIREETTSDSYDILDKYDNYKQDYKEYNNKYESIQDSISIFLASYYNIIDWPEKRIQDPNEEQYFSSNLTIEGAQKKLRDESDRIAENIVTEGVVFRSRGDKDLSRAIYDSVEEEFAEEFQYLREKPSDLKSQYQDLRRPTSRFRTGYICGFVEYLRKKYSIPEMELDQQKEDDETRDEQDNSIINAIEESTVNVDIHDEDVITRGKIYLKHTEHDKDRDDINLDDYESREEYHTALEKETPGRRYDSIEILSNGWVRCVNEIRGKNEFSFEDEEIIKRFIDLYPLNTIENIEHSTKHTKKIDE